MILTNINVYQPGGDLAFRLTPPSAENVNAEYFDLWLNALKNLQETIILYLVRHEKWAPGFEISSLV